MRKKYLKKLTIFILATMMILGANQSTLVEAYDQSNIEELSTDTQLERLFELKSISKVYNNYGIIPFSVNNFPNYMPTITFISSPDYTTEEIFKIGLDIYIEDLTYDNRHSEEMMTLLNSPVPIETLNFILDFAGIPYEEAAIFYSVFLETPLWPSYLPLPQDRVDVWEYYDNSRIFAPLVNVNRTMRMGELINIIGLEQLTAGHPLNANGTSFFTAPPRQGLVGTNVFSIPANSPARIGNIVRSTYNNRVDIAQVDVSVSNSTMSRQLPPPWNWPGGVNITNFRGSPANNQQVRTIAGFSGVIQGNISNANAAVGGLQNQVLVTPDLGRAGDIGAALIRVSDSAVLGTKRGAIQVNGVWNMVYTNVQNY